MCRRNTVRLTCTYPYVLAFQDRSLTRDGCHDFTDISPIHHSSCRMTRTRKIKLFVSSARDNMHLHQLPAANEALRFSRPAR